MLTDSSSFIERIKQKLDLVDEIGAVVPLRKSGKAFKGLCPFHGERTPSFYVFPETGTWKCFGCNEGGDLFTFVEKQQGLDFREALAALAERAGISLDGGATGEAHAESPETAARKRLRALNEAAAIWLHSQLLTNPEANYARTYLDSRGVNHDSIALWRLGYAPDGDALARYLQAQNYAPQELIDAGLAREREAARGGGLYDYFRNRLIFPIRDARGQTIAFGGRELGGGHPKYLNTPQTAVFDKSATLYGLDLARDAIRRGDRVVIVEGYMDALVTHQYGSRNVVACIGSAITSAHIRQIKKLTRRVTLALDPDAAGESATLRGITVAQQAFDRVVVPVPGAAPDGPAARPGRRPAAPRGIVRFEEQVDAEITVMRLPPGEDPDEFVRRDPAGWQRAIAEATPLIEYLIEAQTADLALETPQGKMEASRRLLPIIAEVRDRVLSGDYVERLAKKLRLDATDMQRELQRARARLDREARPARAPAQEEGGRERDGGHEGAPDDGDPAAARAASAGGASPGLAGELLAEQTQAEYCLGLLLEYPETWGEVYAIVAERDFTGTETRALFAALAAAFAAAAGVGAPFELPTFLEGLPPVLRATADLARGRITPGTPTEGPGLAKAAGDAAYRLKRMRLDAEMTELDYLQRDAEQLGDADGLRALLQHKQQLLSHRRAIDKANRLYG